MKNFNYSKFICDFISISFVVAPVIIITGIMSIAAQIVAAALDRSGGLSYHECMCILGLGITILILNCAFLAFNIIINDDLKWKDFFAYYLNICKKVYKRFKILTEE